MKEYRFRWHTWVGTGLLFLLLVTIFFPGLSISTDKYINSAVEANRYALGKDSGITNAQDIVDNYKEGASKRKDLEKSYKEVIEESSLSRFFLAKWLLRVDKGLELEEIHLQEEQSLKDTGVRTVLRFWGWLIYIPFLLCMVTFVFVLVKRCTFSGLLLANGLVTLLCECISYFLIPSLLWAEGRAVILSFDLVSEETLNQYGTGERFVQELFHHCTGTSSIIVIVLSVLISIYAIWCMALWSGKRVVQYKAGKYEYVFQQNLEVWDKVQSESRRTSIKSTGELRCIKGEYIGQSIEIHSGEEIVFGRDPQYCMLIFSGSKVSRKQCGIRYDAVNGCYQVIDYSSNGTTLSDGTLLTTSGYTTLLPGTVVYIASGSEAFLVV